MFISIIVINELDDVTICEGGKAAFSCELNTANTNISSGDVHWYRLTKNANTPEMINSNGADIMFTTSHKQNVLTTTLTITHIRMLHTGYYWVKSPSDYACNVSVTVGRSTYIYRALTCKMYVILK